MADQRTTSTSSDVGAPNGHSLLDTTKANATAALNTATNGPVARSVKDQGQKTTDEFANLAAARKTPSTLAATGQSLTHYHSFFTELLSWNNPRASAIAYASVVAFIFATRYLDALRWGFKLTWMVLGVTIAAEIAGKLLLNNGLASQVRPRKYYTVPRQNIDAAVGDIHELINFFVIEAQRIAFAESVPLTVLIAGAAFLSYYLVNIVPYWGLAVIASTVAFLTPLIYKTNKGAIDEFLQHVSDIVGDQTKQIRDVASKRTSQATEITKQYMGDYTAKAQQILTGHTSPDPVTTDSTGWKASESEESATKKSIHSDSPVWSAPKTTLVKESDFPAVPTREPAHPYGESLGPVVPAKTGQTEVPLSSAGHVEVPKAGQESALLF